MYKNYVSRLKLPQKLGQKNFGVTSVFKWMFYRTLIILIKGNFLKLGQNDFEKEKET